MTLRREYNQYVSHASPQKYYSSVSDMLMPEYANTQTSIPSPGVQENAPHHTYKSTSKTSNHSIG